MKAQNMLAVITGDIIQSQKHAQSQWLPKLKAALNYYGKSPKTWQIYRGDSFQLSCTKENAVKAALHIKSQLKQIEQLDVRMAIGLGEITYESKAISESNGSAFVRSGKCFDNLRKNRLLIHSENQSFDDTVNIMLQLAALTTDQWTVTVAEVVQTALENPDENQQDWAARLGKSQGNISEALKRGGFDEVMKLENWYRQNVNTVQSI